MKSAVALVAVALAFAGPAVAGAATQDGSRDATAAERVAPPRIESALIAEMNRVRADRGRRPLRPVATLGRPARAQSRYLIPLGVLDHDSSDGSPFWTRLLAAGFPKGHALGENLAMVPGCGADVAARTVRVWLRSPGHRANLLNPAFRWVGAGAASNAACGSTILTADYGS